MKRGFKRGFKRWATWRARSKIWTTWAKTSLGKRLVSNKPLFSEKARYVMKNIAGVSLVGIGAPIVVKNVLKKTRNDHGNHMGDDIVWGGICFTFSSLFVIVTESLIVAMMPSSFWESPLKKHRAMIQKHYNSVQKPNRVWFRGLMGRSIPIATFMLFQASFFSAYGFFNASWAKKIVTGKHFQFFQEFD